MDSSRGTVICVLVFLFLHCAGPQQVDSKKEHPATTADTMGITADRVKYSVSVYDSIFITKFDGKKCSLPSIDDVSASIRISELMKLRDSLYIFIHDLTAERSVKVSQEARKLGLDKIQYVITHDYFLIPRSREN